MGGRNYAHYSLEFYSNSKCIKKFWIDGDRNKIKYEKGSNLEEYRKVVHYIFSDVTNSDLVVNISEIVEVKNITFRFIEVH